MKQYMVEMFVLLSLSGTFYVLKSYDIFIELCYVEIGSTSDMYSLRFDNMLVYGMSRGVHKLIRTTERNPYSGSSFQVP
ncbi:hypothetical protein L6452_01714 [Arctium lappa]|uniref:Uncharacterized protein n=1 Tax=Arctium lappa TaxID=4217 RepID=A0ACB9FIR2_ARCLA|nr:hypothetical protein L6452_01714 [Arctium lappa]